MRFQQREYKPGQWYIEPSDHDGCVYIESIDRNIAQHVRVDAAAEIVDAHNGRDPSRAIVAAARALAPEDEDRSLILDALRISSGYHSSQPHLIRCQQAETRLLALFAALDAAPTK